MQRIIVKDDWRTVQVFLSEKGVYEVEISVSGKVKVRCNCPSFKRLFPCVHANYVRKDIDKSPDGLSYSVSIPADVDDDESLDALNDPMKFREFVLRHGKVIVLD
jgi:hypothetical protein